MAVKTILVLAGVIFTILFIAWLYENRKLKQLVTVLKQVADLENGEVQTGGLSLRPRLHLTSAGKPLEISHGSTGLVASPASIYTYLLAKKLPHEPFLFQIQPAPDSGGQAPVPAGLRKVDSGDPALDTAFAFMTSDAAKLPAFLTPAVRAELLKWAGREEGIEEMRNFDDRFFLAVYGMLDTPEQYHDLIASGKVFLDAYLSLFPS